MTTPLAETKDFKLNLSFTKDNRPASAACKQAVNKGGVPLTAEARRVSRQLRTELAAVIITTKKMQARVDQAQSVVVGTTRAVQSTAQGTRERLEQNPRMVKSAQDGDRVQKPIVNAMESLMASSDRSALTLIDAEAALDTQHALLHECITVLNTQWAAREAMLDSAAGGLAAASGPVLDDEGTHACLADAALKEDSARAVIAKALAMAREAAAKLERGKSQVQVSVRTSRDNVVKAKRAAKTGNFGSSGTRETNPATRKIALNPESKGNQGW